MNLANVGQPENKARWVNKALLGKEAHKARKGIWAVPVRKANKGRKVNRVHRASEGYRAKRAIPVRRAQPALRPP